MSNLEQKINEEKLGFFGRLKRRILPYIFATVGLGLTGILGCNKKEDTKVAYRIAFVSDRDRYNRVLKSKIKPYTLYVMNADGTEQTISTNLYPPMAHAWSPDGHMLSFGKNYKIFVEGKRESSEHYYSPDGKQIAFCSSIKDGDEEIYVTNLVDGKQIAVRSFKDGDEEIYVMNADGTNEVNLTNHPANDKNPCWSPDGTKIVFESDRDGNLEIYVMNSDGSNQRNLTNHPANDSIPAWIP